MRLSKKRIKKSKSHIRKRIKKSKSQKRIKKSKTKYKKNKDGTKCSKCDIECDIDIECECDIIKNVISGKTYYNGIYLESIDEYRKFVKTIPKSIDRSNILIYFICFYIKHYIDSMFFFQNSKTVVDFAFEKGQNILKNENLENIHSKVNLDVITKKCETLCKFLYNKSHKDRYKTDTDIEWPRQNKFVIQSLSTGDGFVEYLFSIWLLLNHKIQSLIVSNEPFLPPNGYINKDPYIIYNLGNREIIKQKLYKPSICIGINIQGADKIDKSYFMYNVPVIEIYFDRFIFNYENIDKFNESFETYRSENIEKMKIDYESIKSKFGMINNDNFKEVHFDIVLLFYKLVRISFMLDNNLFNIFVRSNDGEFTEEVIIVGNGINLSEIIKEVLKETTVQTIERIIGN